MKHAKRALSLLLALVLVLGLSTTALAKTASETIAQPEGTANVFYIEAGAGNVARFTWNDITGKGAFQLTTGSYAAKVDNVQTTQSWSGVLLADLLASAEKTLGMTFADDYKIKAVAADGYVVSFTVGDVRDSANRYMVAGDPVSNADGDTKYANSYVRIVRGDSDTLSNQANIRCLLGLEVLDANGNSLTGNGKTQGGDVENAVFYIAVKESADSALKVYYYTRDELEAIGETHAFNYNDHTVDKTVTARGASLRTLLDSITDAEITDDMIIQYAESDGYHADAATAVEDSSYKDKVGWLDATHVDAGGETAAAVDTMISLEIMETYAKPDENNVNDTAWKDADANSGYLRAYRQRADANSAVIKYLMGVVVSYNGSVFSGKDGYTLEALSAKNSGTAIQSYSAITGLVPGMQYAVKAPEVNNAKLSAGQPAYKVITAVAGSSDIKVSFTYDEDAYFTVTKDGVSTEYVYTDFLTHVKKAQTPTAEAGAALLDSTGGISYGYYDTMLYRYNGVWLRDLVGETDEDVTLTSAKGETVVIKAADVDKYFVAYNNTQSKSSTNVPEGKRVTKTYTAPKVILPGDGVMVSADEDSKLIGEKGKMATVVLENVAGATVGKVSFTDLAGYGWAKEAIEALYDKGVVNGTGDGKFAPSKQIKRGDFMLMLVRAYELTAETDGNFADVKAGAYYADAIAVARALGIAKGDGVNFQPEASITREEAMALLYRTMAVKGVAPAEAGDLSAFSDADEVKSWFTDAVSALVGAGIINGSDGKLNPAGYMTRAQLSVALYNALSK